MQLNTSGVGPANDGPLAAELVGRLWACKGGYFWFDPSGTMNLFGAGFSFRYESIMLAHLNGSARAALLPSSLNPPDHPPPSSSAGFGAGRWVR